MVSYMADDIADDTAGTIYNGGAAAGRTQKHGGARPPRVFVPLYRFRRVVRYVIRYVTNHVRFLCCSCLGPGGVADDVICGVRCDLMRLCGDFPPLGG